MRILRAAKPRASTSSQDACAPGVSESKMITCEQSVNQATPPPSRTSFKCIPESVMSSGFPPLTLPEPFVKVPSLTKSFWLTDFFIITLLITNVLFISSWFRHSKFLHLRQWIIITNGAEISSLSWVQRRTPRAYVHNIYIIQRSLFSKANDSLAQRPIVSYKILMCLRVFQVGPS